MLVRLQPALPTGNRYRACPAQDSCKELLEAQEATLNRHSTNVPVQVPVPVPGSERGPRPAREAFAACPLDPGSDWDSGTDSGTAVVGARARVLAYGLTARELPNDPR
jgi:hypothetical protein